MKQLFVFMRIKMNYKIDMYGFLKNILMFVVLVIAVIFDKYEFAVVYALWNIGISLTDISVNLKER